MVGKIINNEQLLAFLPVLDSVSLKGIVYKDEMRVEAFL